MTALTRQNPQFHMAGLGCVAGVCGGTTEQGETETKSLVTANEDCSKYMSHE